MLRLPELADTFEAIATRGAAALYRGERARAIVATVRDGGGELTLDDLAALPRRLAPAGARALPRPRGALEPAAVLGRRPDRLRARAARAAARRRRPGSAEAVAALAEVMREQGRARGGALRPRPPPRRPRGAACSSPQRSRAAQRAHRARTWPARASRRRPGGTTHISVLDADGNAAALSTSTGSGSGVFVPGTGIYLNNMLGEYDLVGGVRRAPAAADEHDGADDRARRPTQPAPRRRQRRLGAAPRRDHADRRERPPARASAWRRRSRRRASTSTSRTSTARAAHDPAELDRLGGAATTSSAGGAATSSSAALRGRGPAPTDAGAAAGDPRRGGAGVLVE